MSNDDHRQDRKLSDDTVADLRARLDRAVAGGAVFLAPISTAQDGAPYGLDALDGCDARVRSAPRDPLSYYCYLLAVRGGSPAADAVRRLDAILAIDPARHRARMILGMIEDGRGNPRAEPLLRDAVDGMEAAGDHHGVVYGGLSLAFRLGNEGRLGEAAAVVFASLLAWFVWRAALRLRHDRV
jgi:hypothetical protein